MNVFFSHANGFPAQTYFPMFNGLTIANLNYIPMLGHGDQKANGDVFVLVRELVQGIEKCCSSPVVGIGHSIGATVTFLAAVERPDLFERIVLLDPPIFSLKKRLLIRGVHKLGIGTASQLTSKALNRRSNFGSLEEAKCYFSQKALFQRFDSACFESYLQNGLVPEEQGLRLAFDNKVEADLFGCLLLDMPKGANKLSGTLIYGRDSNTFEHSDRKWWATNMPGFELLPADGGHLFPLEHPGKTATLINKVLGTHSPINDSSACLDLSQNT